jgi:hypothetical protein
LDRSQGKRLEQGFVQGILRSKFVLSI